MDLCSTTPARFRPPSGPRPRSPLFLSRSREGRALSGSADAARPCHSEARSDGYSCTLVLFWLVGIILFEKSFAYLHVGPLYITELVLGVLLLNNIRRFQPMDWALAAAVALYLIIGVLRHGSFSFAAKDLLWMPYLFFLRFFPRNFPARYVKIVIACCFLKLLSLLALPVLPLPSAKYCEAIIILFCFLYVTLHNEGRIHWPFFGLCVVAAVLINFKTLLIVMLIAPLALNAKLPWQRLVAPGPFAAVAAILLFMVTLDYTRDLLVFSVNLLNRIADVTGLPKHFDTATAEWRAEIWTRALDRLIRDGQLLFGQFPGFNFLDDKYLAMELHLQGGQGLGIVRTAHNILVQMVMKAGIAGVLVFGWYFFHNLPARDRLSMFYVACVFLLALTADIFEVPTRGPLFYCLFVLLLRVRSEREAGSVPASSLVSGKAAATARSAPPERTGGRRFRLYRPNSSRKIISPHA